MKEREAKYQEKNDTDEVRGRNRDRPIDESLKRIDSRGGEREERRGGRTEKLESKRQETMQNLTLLIDGEIKYNNQINQVCRCCFHSVITMQIKILKQKTPPGRLIGSTGEIIRGKRMDKASMDISRNDIIEMHE